LMLARGAMYRQMPRNPSIFDALGIGEIRDVMNDYLVDDILFCVFQISDVGYVISKGTLQELYLLGAYFLL